MRKVTTVWVLTALAFLAGSFQVSGTAHAATEVLSQGWNEVRGPFVVRAGELNHFELGRAQFTQCFSGFPCFGNDPHVVWGDGNLDPNAPENSHNLNAVDCSTGGPNPFNCLLVGDHAYASPGVYTVTFFYNTTAGTFYRAVTTVIVEPNVGVVHPPLPLDRFTIISVGDSVASGEGNPMGYAFRLEPPFVVPILVPVWEDGLGGNSIVGLDDPVQCHRSTIAGPAQSAASLRETNPETQVPFLHLACSGADSFLVGGQINDIPSHVPAGERIDALLMSVGANDQFGRLDSFGGSLGVCLDLSELDCGSNSDLVQQLATKFSRIQERYDNVATAIASLRGQHTVDNIYITEYFDPTHDEAGRFGDVFSDFFTCTGDLITPREWSFLHDNEVAPLNNAVREAAARNSWHAVDGIEAGFVNHGYCAISRHTNWVLTVDGSLFFQFDLHGTAHPQSDGHAWYRDRIVATIAKNTPPRTDIAALAGGAPYSFGAWTNQDVEVRLAARNLAQAGAKQMDWSLLQRNTVLAARTVPEQVIHSGSCDQSDSEPCRSVLTDRVVVSQEGESVLNVASVSAWGVREPERAISIRLDKTPPTVMCSVTPNVLWPPNHKLVPVTATVTVVDALSGPAGFTLVSVTSSEPDSGPGAGHTLNDIQGFVTGAPSTTGQLRAERSGGGPGRVYTLTYQGKDVAGNAATCAATVTVPHSGRHLHRGP